MEKCSGSIASQRMLSKHRSKEEWTKSQDHGGGKPHANISDEEVEENSEMGSISWNRRNRGTLDDVRSIKRQ